MTKTFSIVGHKIYNLIENEHFVMFLTSKLMTCYIDSFTSKRKSQSFAYIFNENKHMYEILDLENSINIYIQYGLIEQAVIKNARAILFFEVGQSREQS